MTPTSTPTSGPQFTSRPRDDDRTTRKPLALWDRVKYLLLLAALFWFFVWAAIADNPLLPFNDAVNDTVSEKRWIFLLAALELVRQIHYLISERSAAYHRFWTQKVFGGFNRRSARLSDWNRYRLARLAKILVFLVILSIVLGTIFDTSPALALVELPSRIVDALPFVFQLMFGALFIIIEFGALFWLLTRGGVDVYYPDDIKTRFSDVWGQDNVLARVRENMVFLEDPEAIEEKGGYVPGGHPALGAARHRQDADGRGGGGRDRQALRVRRPRCFHQHVHGRRRPQGQERVPQAPAPRAPVRRRHRLLRRGRLAR